MLVNTEYLGIPYSLLVIKQMENSHKDKSGPFFEVPSLMKPEGNCDVFLGEHTPG